MWKWIQDNSPGITATVAILIGLAGITLFIIRGEVDSQILDNVQPKIVKLEKASTRHDEAIQHVRNDLREIKTSIKEMDQKFTDKFAKIHDVLIPMRDAIVEIQRDIRELKQP